MYWPACVYDSFLFNDQNMDILTFEFLFSNFRNEHPASINLVLLRTHPINFKDKCTISFKHHMQLDNTFMSGDVYPRKNECLFLVLNHLLNLYIKFVCVFFFFNLNIQNTTRLFTGR